MALEPAVEVLFHLDDPEPAHRTVLDTVAATDTEGWTNLAPVPEPGEEPPARNLFVAIFSARGPTLPLATVSRSGHDDGRLSIGLQHPGGPKALDRLAREGLPLPAGWLKVADHPRRGLVVTVPAAEASAAVDWLLQAARLLTLGPLPTQWSARRYVP
jgi:hypothetical protein